MATKQQQYKIQAGMLIWEAVLINGVASIPAYMVEQATAYCKSHDHRIIAWEGDQLKVWCYVEPAKSSSKAEDAIRNNRQRCHEEFMRGYIEKKNKKKYR